MSHSALTTTRLNRRTLLWTVGLCVALLYVVGTGALEASQARTSIALLAPVLPIALYVIWRFPISVPLLLFVVLYTRASDVAITYHGLPSIAQPFVTVMAVVAAVRRWYQQRFVASPVRPWVLYAALTYLAVLFGSAVWAPHPDAALAQATDFAKDLLIVYVLIEFFATPRDLRLLVWSLIVAGVALATLSWFQALTGTYDNSYGGFAQAPVRQITLQLNSERSAGPIGDPNFYALILCGLVPLALGRLRDETAVFLRLLAALCVFLLTVGIVLTYSRSALLVLALLAIIALPLLHVRPRHLVPLTLCVVPMLAFVPASYWQRAALLTSLSSSSTSSTTDTSLTSRLGSLEISLRVFEDHPLLGVGAGNFMYTYFPYALELNQPDVVSVPHDLLLQVAAETGGIGLGSFGTLIALVVSSGWLARRRVTGERDDLRPQLADFTLLAFAAFLLGSLFLPYVYSRYIWIYAGLVLATAYPYAPSRLMSVRARAG